MRHLTLLVALHWTLTRSTRAGRRGCRRKCRPRISRHLGGQADRPCQPPRHRAAQPHDPVRPETPQPQVGSARLRHAGRRHRPRAASPSDLPLGARFDADRAVILTVPSTTPAPASRRCRCATSPIRVPPIAVGRVGVFPGTGNRTTHWLAHRPIRDRVIAMHLCSFRSRSGA